MTLIRWNPTSVHPLRELGSVQDEVNRLFDGIFTRGTLRGDLNAIFTPAVDIEETAEEFVVRVDLPGVAQKDVKVSLMGDTLTIRLGGDGPVLKYTARIGRNARPAAGE